MEIAEPGATAVEGVAPAPLVTAPAGRKGTVVNSAVTERGWLIKSIPNGVMPFKSPLQLRN